MEVLMEHYHKHKLELLLVDLLGLPKGTQWFELRCAIDEIPMVRCEYEVHNGEFPLVANGKIATLKEEYEVYLKPIKRGAYEKG